MLTTLIRGLMMIISGFDRELIRIDEFPSVILVVSECF